ncbi:Tripartite tricarboxylate transporter family receptor [compost metagenome]
MASSGHSTGPLMYKKLGYDPVKDFRFIRNIIEIPNVMTVPANSPYDSVAAFIAAAREKPLTFSSSGVGSSIHMSALLFMAMTGTRMAHVPLASSAEVRSSLLSGEVDVAFDNLPAVLAPIRAGQLKALAVTSRQPSPYLPGVGSLAALGAEYGLADFVVTAWFGLIADDSMTQEAVARLQMAMDNIMADESFRDFVVKMGAAPAKQAGAAFRDYVAEDVRRWKRVASQTHLAD